MIKKLLLPVLLAVFITACTKPDVPVDPVHVIDTVYVYNESSMRSIQEFGVLPENNELTNRKNLQAAIDWATESGAALYVTPVENGYKIKPGIVLKKNVSLIGAQGPTGRGTCNKDGDGPTGSLFVITDPSHPFITVESATKISGIQFYYPEQSWKDSTKVIQYEPTIQVSHESAVNGVTLRDLTFYGEWMAMDFRADEKHPCEQILFEDCYGYPFSGMFIAIDRCYDIPRILHCHVNPANTRCFHRSIDRSVFQYVINRGTYTYWIDRTDNLVMVDIFTYGVFGGLYLGSTTYGQLTSFNFDCVTEGIHKDGPGGINKNWQISQGAIIANLGEDYNKIHPFIIEGTTRTNISNVDAFSGALAGVKSIGAPRDFIYVTGRGFPTVTLTGCTAEQYFEDFVTIDNSRAYVRANSCVDKRGNFFDYLYEGSEEPLVGDNETMWDTCDNIEGWKSVNKGLGIDNTDYTEGTGSLRLDFSSTGKSLMSIFKTMEVPVDPQITKSKGHFRFDFYLSSTDWMDDSEATIEITSSGTYDVEEAYWNWKRLNLKPGWNSVDLPVYEAGLSGSTDFRAINFFRIYNTGAKGEFTIKLDNLRFYQEP